GSRRERNFPARHPAASRTFLAGNNRHLRLAHRAREGGRRGDGQDRAPGGPAVALSIPATERDSGLVDAPGRWLVGAKGEYPTNRALSSLDAAARRAASSALAPAARNDGMSRGNASAAAARSWLAWPTR